MPTTALPESTASISASSSALSSIRLARRSRVCLVDAPVLAEKEFVSQSDICRRAVIADMRERGLLPEKGI
jgi:hypothetical protein